MITENVVSEWVEGYVRAWRSVDPTDLREIFTEEAESHEWPYETHWVGLNEIAHGWKAREQWQAGGWTFDWQLLAINGDTFAIQGVGTYEELGTFDNLWVATLDPRTMKCTTFRMWNNEVPIEP